jgi:molybdopterin-containing oxidoreductase family iron-sulfur binding subunit
MWKVSLLKGDQERNMASNKTYWKTIDQLDSSNEEIKKLEQNEFVSKLPEDFLSDEKTLEESNTSRRDFLKYVGFSTAAATLAACEGPVIKSVPYVVQPEQIRPGVANYYATTIANGFDFGSVLIKTREGRPIKVESNPEAPVLRNCQCQSARFCTFFIRHTSSTRTYSWWTRHFVGGLVSSNGGFAQSFSGNQ